MRCAKCDERFTPREETIMHEHDDVLRRFHPGCYLEWEQENPGGDATWSGGPPYQDIILLNEEDFKNVVGKHVDAFNLERLLSLEETGRDREGVKDWLQEKITQRNDLLDQVGQIEE